MEQKLVIKKGYTLEVVSWENDGDNYNTLSHTYKTKEQALAMKGLVKLSDRSTTRTNNGIGNLNDWTPVHRQLVVDYLKTNPVVIPEDWDAPNDDNDYIEIWRELIDPLMGGSEWYISRVHESSVLIYSDKDIYLEIIK